MAVILVIEDNIANMEYIKEILELGDHLCIEAIDGQTGLELARSRKPDLILLDIQLPKMDGSQVIKALLECQETKDIPAVALTAHAMRGDRQRFLDAGFHRYLSKPIQYKELLSVIDELLNGEK